MLADVSDWSKCELPHFPYIAFMSRLVIGQNMHCLIFHFNCNMNSLNMNCLVSQVPATGTERLPSVRATARRVTMSAAEMTAEMVNMMTIVMVLIMSLMRITTVLNIDVNKRWPFGLLWPFR